MEDRRIFERFGVDFSTEIKMSEAQNSSFAQCCDVSAGGAGLFTKEELMPKAELEIWLNIPDGYSAFRTLARVVWSKQVQEDKWQSGLRFKTVDLMGIRRILGKPSKRK